MDVLARFVLSRQPWADSEIIEEVPEIEMETSSVSSFSTLSLVPHVAVDMDTTTMTTPSLKSFENATTVSLKSFDNSDREDILTR